MDDKFKEFLKDFVKWIKIKVRVHISDNTFLQYKQRDIWWTNVGLNIGSEQNGKNENFERPVLVLRKFGHNLFWAVPTTTNCKKNIYRHKIKYKTYFKDEGGGVREEEKEGIIILNQLKAMSSKRLIRKIGVIPEEEFEIVRKKLGEII